LANPHLALCAPSYRARDTPPLCSPSAFIMLSPPPHLCSPVSPGMCPSPVALLSRASTPGEKDSGEPEWAPGIWMGSRLTILVLCINAIVEVELEFCLAMHSRFYSLSRFLPLSPLPSPALLAVHLDHSYRINWNTPPCRMITPSVL
jgi:hypothetical protein